MLTYMFSTQIQSNLQATLGELHALSHMFCAENVAVYSFEKDKVICHLTCVARKKEMCIFHELQRGQLYFTLKNPAASMQLERYISLSIYFYLKNYIEVLSTD